MKKELDELVRFISRYPEGISVGGLLNLYSEVIPKRTLQYRLGSLVKSGVIRNIGVGKQSKYCIEKPIESEPFVERPSRSEQRTSIIPLSIEGEEVRGLISLPIQLRPHVSYRREFLDAYEPNKTFYLSPSHLESLARLGAGAEKGRPAGTYARKIYQRLLIDLSWNSSRLEGNTYSLLETERLLSEGEAVSGKDRIDTQMILNHKEAIEFIVEMAEEVDVNRFTVLNIHGLLSCDLILDPKACGRLRVIPVKIGQSVYHPIEVPQIIEECFQLIIDKAALIENPFEQSFFLMVHLPYLQPFLDVNKRVSRLAGNIPFIRENLSPLSFVDVPEIDYTQGLLAIYELNRIELFRDVFMWAYERSASLYLATLESLGAPDPFRIRYRDLIRQTVASVVKNKIPKKECSQFVAKVSNDQVPAIDQNRFIEVVEVEIMSLHEGNFARFKLRASEFFAWQGLI
jgi:hypothetical protein